MKLGAGPNQYLNINQHLQPASPTGVPNLRPQSASFEERQAYNQRLQETSLTRLSRLRLTGIS